MTDSDGSPLQSLRYVGPATADVLATEEIEVVDIEQKRVSYRQLTRAGVNPGVAAKIRREHSLPWTLGGFESDLDTRSETVRGLRADERRWVAQSGANWAEREPVTTSDRQQETPDGYGQQLQLAAAPETLVPTTRLGDVDDTAATRLADAGVNTVQRLAVVAPGQLATAIEVDEATVRRWQETARQYLADRDR